MADAVPIRVVLADDHTMLREGLRRSLQTHGIDVVGEAGNGLEAIELAADLRPDAVLMDVTMPILDGIEATKRIKAAQPATPVVVLSMHVDAELQTAAEAAGAAAYLVKDCATADIVNALHEATGHEPPGPPPDKLLTQRETEVLQLLANGLGTTEAAAALYVSVKTVKNHLASAYGKLDAHDRTQAVIKAARMGIVTLPR